MGRKSISTYKLNKIKKLLSESYTSKEIAAELKISSATVSNYRAYFKKKGELNINDSNDTLVPSGKKNILNKSSSLKVSKTTNSFSTSYKYIVNGTIINFKQKPKSITIGKSEFVVDI
jgi:predicted transcriptional regulator